MKNDVRVVGLTLRDRQQKNGNHELAFFDIVTDGFVIRSCLLIAFKTHVDFNGPRLAINDNIHAIDIRDNLLRAAIIAAALRAYCALGGTHPVDAPAPAVATEDPERKLLRDIGLTDAVEAKQAPRKRGPQLPSEIIAALEQRGYATK